MKSCDKLIDAGRRKFLLGGAATAAVGVAATALPRRANAATALARVTCPTSRLANMKDLKVNEPKEITYPDAQSPGVLLKLGRRVDGGVGPDGDIVAFSTLCPHKGFDLNYSADDKTLNCPGHYSRFDCEKGGLEVFGHATQNLPQFKLRVDSSGTIYAEGVDELIYGRLSNVLSA